MSRTPPLPAMAAALGSPADGRGFDTVAPPHLRSQFKDTQSSHLIFERLPILASPT
jgi:hypothetical protein